MGKKVQEKTVIQLDRIKLERLEVTIEALPGSTLITHRFGEKALKAITDKQQQKQEGAEPREAKDPKALFEEAKYPMPGNNGACGFPAIAVKKAMVSACRGLPADWHMTDMRQAIFVFGNAGGLIEIKGAKARPREDRVRIDRKKLDLRYRPEFENWHATFEIGFLPGVISREQVLKVLNLAGFTVGLCDWRVECDGDHGMFQLRPDISQD